MSWNPWRHVRLAGCISLILSGFINSPILIMAGFILVASGIVGGIDRAERILDQLTKEEDNGAV